MKLLAPLLIGLTLAHSAVAGTPDQDPKVRKLRALFRTAPTLVSIPDRLTPSHWTCTSHDAFRDDFYSEPEMTFRFTREPWEVRTFSNHGSIIFKELELTDDGIRSVRVHPAYCAEPVQLVLRPLITKSGLHLVGEVSVENRSLPSISRYYGYDHVLSGVPSVLDAGRTVYYYLICTR